MKGLQEFSNRMLRSSVLWGLFVTVGFFWLLHSGAVAKLPQGPRWESFLLRYTAAHPIEYIETAMCFIALAALWFKWLEIVQQDKLLATPLLGDRPVAGESDDPQELLARLQQHKGVLSETWLHRRLTAALEHVTRTGGADELEEQLKYLGDIDAGKAGGGYGFVRILIWAIPIMGFLGTVVGITDAIANLSDQDLVGSLPSVTAGLGVAFDTTALALVEATILMFSQFVVEQREGKLLDRVEIRTNEELAGRFETSAGTSDPQIAAVRRMAETVLKATERTVERQSEVWRQTIDSAHARWSELNTASEKQLETALQGALRDALSRHAEQVDTSARALVADSHQQWTTLQQSLERGSAALLETQTQLSRQADTLLRIVQTSGEVTRLEETLQRNLGALAGAHHFEETVQSLAAAIHLLTGRLGHVPTSGRGDSRSVGQAA